MKNNKGITLITLVLTIAILSILSGTIIYNMNISNNAGEYNNLVADAELLRDKILVYYNKNGDIPKTNRSIKIDEMQYYEIDLKQLGGVTLNYGREYGNSDALTTLSDVYLVNENLDVYYLRGIERDGEMCH